MNMISISKGLHTNSTMPTLQNKLGKHQYSRYWSCKYNLRKKKERERETFLPVKENTKKFRSITEPITCEVDYIA